MRAARAHKEPLVLMVDDRVPRDNLDVLEKRIDATVTKPSPTETAERAYDILLDGLRTGRFGGLPCMSPASVALVEVLRSRDWPVNYRAFAGAMPHYAEDMGLLEMRSTLSLLGAQSECDRIKGRNLAALPHGSFVVSDDARYLFLRLDGFGLPALFDPHEQTFEPLRPNHTYTSVIFDDAEGDSAPAAKTSWIGGTLNRFGPENRIIMILTFLSNTLIIMASLSVGFIFDKVLPAKAYDTLLGLLIGVGLLLYADLSIRRIKARIIAQVSGRLEYIVSSSLYEKLTTFRLEMLTASSVSEQINRLKQFELVRDFFSGPIVAVLFELPFVVLLLAAIFVVNPPVALLLLAVVATYLVVGLTMYPKITRASQEMSGLRAETLRLQEETISQREQIVQRGLGRVWAARLAPKQRKLSLARHKVESVWRTLNSLITVASPLSIGGVIVIGATQVITGNMTGGGLIVCMILSTRLLSPVQQALVLAVRAPELANMFRQIDTMMQIPAGDPTRMNAAAQKNRHNDKAPGIVLDGLVLRYPRSVAPALKGVTLKIDGGSLTCITGPSGAGKSSLLRVIMGHYRAQNGMVLIGASNIEQFDSQKKTDLIGYLGHRSLQIHGTLAQNLLLTRPETTPEQMEAICDEVGILDAITSLPAGFQTRLDHQSRFRFSPSFRTKFAVAQLLLKEPKVLLLDEPESGLSDEDEARLMSVIKSRAGQMTSIMVTHRPSLVQQADQALVLTDGQIKFFGPPNKRETRKA